MLGPVFLFSSVVLLSLISFRYKMPLGLFRQKKEGIFSLAPSQGAYRFSAPLSAVLAAGGCRNSGALLGRVDSRARLLGGGAPVMVAPSHRIGVLLI